MKKILQLITISGLIMVIGCTPEGDNYYYEYYNDTIVQIHHNFHNVYNYYNQDTVYISDTVIVPSDEDGFIRFELQDYSHNGDFDFTVLNDNFGLVKKKEIRGDHFTAIHTWPGNRMEYFQVLFERPENTDWNIELSIYLHGQLMYNKHVDSSGVNNLNFDVYILDWK